MTAKYSLILPLMISGFYLKAQEIKKETKRFGMGGSSEVFYVSKQNKTREGPYLLKSRSGQPLISGYYSEGQKDSVWTYYEFGRSGQPILSKHFYKKGIRTGIWEFYKHDTLMWTYNFDSSKVNYIQPEDTTENANKNPAYQDEHNNWVYLPPDKHTMLISSDYSLKLMANLTYPEEAQNRHQQGQVSVAVLIDQQGNPESYDIGISSGSPYLDAEALRVIKLVDLEYIPAEEKGVKVKSLVLLKVNFRMEFQ